MRVTTTTWKSSLRRGVQLRAKKMDFPTLLDRTAKTKDWQKQSKKFGGERKKFLAATNHEQNSVEKKKFFLFFQTGMKKYSTKTRDKLTT